MWFVVLLWCWSVDLAAASDRGYRSWRIVAVGTSSFSDASRMGLNPSTDEDRMRYASGGTDAR